MARYRLDGHGVWKATHRWTGGRLILKPQEGQSGFVLVHPEELGMPWWTLMQEGVFTFRDSYKVPCIRKCGAKVTINWSKKQSSLTCKECRK